MEQLKQSHPNCAIAEMAVLMRQGAFIGCQQSQTMTELMCKKHASNRAVSAAYSEQKTKMQEFMTGMNNAS